MKLLSKNFVKYGLILTAIMIVCLFLMEITGQNKTFEHSPLAAFYTLLAPLIVCFFGLQGKRKSQEGKLTYKQGLAEGFKISVVYGIISPFIVLAYYPLINPEIVASAREAYMLKDAPDVTMIQIEMLVQFVSAIVLGTLYGAVLTIFLRTKSK